MKTSNSTTYFTLFAFGLVVVHFWIVSLPYLSNSLYTYTGIDPLTWIGSGGVLGPKKIALIYTISAVMATLLVAGYLLTMLGSGRMARLLVLTLTLPLVWASTIWVDLSTQGRAMERLHLSALPSVAYGAIFNDAAINRADINTYDEFYQAVEANFQRHKDGLKVAWNTADENRLRAFFYLNTVANLFAYGNTNPDALGGCANLNEESGGKQRDRGAMGVRYYTETRIGCCTDYANVLNFLLNEAGIENRVATLHIRGHFFNEVKLNGKWHALDANIGLFYGGSWNDFIKDDGPLSVIRFPVLSMDASRPETYRPILAKFRHHILTTAAQGMERVEYSQPISNYRNVDPAVYKENQ